MRDEITGEQLKKEEEKTRRWFLGFGIGLFVVGILLTIASFFLQSTIPTLSMEIILPIRYIPVASGAVTIFITLVAFPIMPASDHYGRYEATIKRLLKR